MIFSANPKVVPVAQTCTRKADIYSKQLVHVLTSYQQGRGCAKHPLISGVEASESQAERIGFDNIALSVQTKRQ